MKIAGVSFSASENSMNYRGLELMDKVINFSSIQAASLPLCNSNKPDGVVPASIIDFWSKIQEADICVFSVPECTGHYSAAFKNAMDWFVVKGYFNATLGKNYPFSNKPVFVYTFTPSVNTDVGGRHFKMTKHLLEKMGADIRSMVVKNDCWNKLYPNNIGFIEQDCKQILNCKLKNYDKTDDIMHKVAPWQKKYEEWNTKWKK